VKVKIDSGMEPAEGTCPNCKAKGVENEGCPSCPGFWFE
jgi:hypothetical protein